MLVPLQEADVGFLSLSFFFLSREKEIVLYIFNEMVFRLNNYKTAL